jgi:hypothetical protein
MLDIFNISLILGICKDYGPIAGWLIVVWLLWKIATNHLRHLKTDNVEIKKMITTLSTDVKASTKELNEKIESVEGKVNSLGERTAKLEGQVQ